MINEIITDDFFVPIKYVNNAHRIMTGISEIPSGMKISLIGISVILSKNNSDTGNNAKIKWWNPNLVSNFYYLQSSSLM